MHTVAEIEVVAGILTDAAGCVLIQERPSGTHLAGSWEFPGGKVAANEPHQVALAREWREEVGLQIWAGQHVASHRHPYPNRCVHLHLYEVVWRAAGTETPTSCEGQRLAWVHPTDWPSLPWCEADVILFPRIFEFLQVPPQQAYALTTAATSPAVAKA